MRDLIESFSGGVGWGNRKLYTSFWEENMNDSKNTDIVKATIEYILSTERFNLPLFE